MAYKFSFTSEVWLYPGMSGWHFMTIDKTRTKEINALFGHAKRGWGSLPVTVKIGKSEWKTSIFHDTKSGTYLLAVKALIRKQEKISTGDKIKANVSILS